MWLITPIGFFSIVEKPTDKRHDMLTVRARVRSDLVGLKQTTCPTLGRISESADTDYRYRATAKRSDVARALAQMIEQLGYSNFKSEVSARQGAARAHLYHDVWEVLHRIQDDPVFQTSRSRPVVPRATIPDADTYGGVLIDDRGRIQLREVAGYHGGYVWTFAKGTPDPGETPEETALREVLEETGQGARIVAVIPTVFPGTTSTTAFFLMEPVGEAGAFSDETSAVQWVDEKTARRLIGKTTTPVGRERDLAVLDAGIAAWQRRK
jgi:8-oxo-dGTP pyrophosphatase MutT (NUDIX family)